MFVFAICNVSSERWLIREVARLAPGSAPSYRRKGLVTFKLPDGSQDALASSVFARVHGRSLGLAKDTSEVKALLERVEGPLRLQVYARDAGPDGPEPAWTERAAAIEAELRDALAVLEGSTANVGERVADVIVAGDEPLLVGLRTQGAGWRVPGGRPRVDVPEDAPSRAFAKMEEALSWSGLALEPGELALELGSAPGGAAYALARRGVSVLGLDPAAMDPRVLAYRGPGGARVTHLPLKAGALRRHHVPRECSLLVCDANLAPPVILRTAASVARWVEGPLRAMVLTLKMNDERMIEAIPSLLDRVRALGRFTVSATQLPSNRREICVIAQ